MGQYPTQALLSGGDQKQHCDKDNSTCVSRQEAESQVNFKLQCTNTESSTRSVMSQELHVMRYRSNPRLIRHGTSACNCCQTCNQANKGRQLSQICWQAKQGIQHLSIMFQTLCRRRLPIKLKRALSSEKRPQSGCTLMIAKMISSPPKRNSCCSMPCHISTSHHMANNSRAEEDVAGAHQIVIWIIGSAKPCFTNKVQKREE